MAERQSEQDAGRHEEAVSECDDGELKSGWVIVIQRSDTSTFLASKPSGAIASSDGAPAIFVKRQWAEDSAQKMTRDGIKCRVEQVKFAQPRIYHSRSLRLEFDVFRRTNFHFNSPAQDFMRPIATQGRHCQAFITVDRLPDWVDCMTILENRSGRLFLNSGRKERNWRRLARKVSKPLSIIAKSLTHL